MNNGIASLPREILSRALGNDVRAVRAFEQEAANNDALSEQVAANVDATEALNDATVLVLSSNAAFNNERVLRVGPGIRARDDGASLTLSVNDEVPHVLGGFPVNLTATQASNLLLPTAGRIATTDQPETLTQKIVSVPLFSSVPEYATDAEAKVGDVYTLTGSTALHFRRA